ncbi:MAG: RNase adapter RapZ [Proteobacteria bacterium]|nr:RNase adapter RapZ [Pseudomonadota bacterium]MBU1386987.1 RNase adapter RapZ [Pseudomonadota bacterium]MBU1542332.1 RNase adapter RapZ [Pseudomonadota bacterium]MBU2481795.1 RNase adapter RapZ [Pseudomonadota bacterium]
MQNVYIITGLSGSGKTTAIQAFEDASFYCVDNMPMELLPKFLDLPLKKDPKIKGLVFVMDMRSQNFITNYSPGICAVEELGITPETIFLEADEDTLLNRFSQTRRQHPVSDKKSLRESIRHEKEMMQPIKQTAHHIINTTNLNIHQLKSRILDLINKGKPFTSLTKINILSFGFKYGIPNDADLVMDMRFLTNPYFVPELKPLDGESDAVRNFVLANEETQLFLEKYLDLLDYLIPLYKRENKAYLTFAIGCTGGRHRSVAIARTIFEHLNKKGLNPGLIHRDIDRDVKDI